jgi:adenosine deaminase
MNAVATTALTTLIDRMPKVELHLHLEGAIQPATLLRIARRNGIDIPARDEAGVAQLFRYQNFHEFLTVFMALARSLMRGEDFEDIAYELGQTLANQHVLYAEVMISPAQYVLRGLDINELVEGAAAGFARVERERNIRFALAFDYGRQCGVDLAWNILENAIRNRRHGVVAWSIGGDEAFFPPEPFAEVYQAARKAGLHTMAHAGEVVGPISVWGAMEALGCERLGHGIRSIEDANLLERLRERRVTLDISPTSNVRTGAVASFAEHPIRRLFDAGVLITVNTDDPTFFNTTLTDEYRLLVREYGFDADSISQLIFNSVQASFLPEQEKLLLHNRVKDSLKQLRDELGL